MRGLVTAKAASAERAKQMPQQPKSQEVDRFVGKLEFRGTGLNVFHTLRILIECGGRLLICSHPTFLDHPSNQLIDELIEFFGVPFTSVLDRRYSSIQGFLVPIPFHRVIAI